MAAAGIVDLETSGHVSVAAAKRCIARRSTSSARFTFALPERAVTQVMTDPSDYATILDGIVSNVKWGPFKGTSGQTVEYYLNASSNMLDQTIAGKIGKQAIDMIEVYFKPSYSDGDGDGGKVVLIGPEMAGGALVSQIAALAGDRLEWCDFAYMRKNRKTSGTKQQLEAPARITSRTPDSPPLRAIIIDDCCATGGSLSEAACTLKADYNFDVIGAFYLVDRSNDRRKPSASEREDKFLRPEMAPIRIVAPYDLVQVRLRLSGAHRAEAEAAAAAGDAAAVATPRSAKRKQCLETVPGLHRQDSSRGAFAGPWRLTKEDVAALVPSAADGAFEAADTDVYVSDVRGITFEQLYELASG